MAASYILGKSLNSTLNKLDICYKLTGAPAAYMLKKHLLLYYLLDLSPPAEEDSGAGHESWALVQSFQAAVRLLFRDPVAIPC